MPHLGWDPTPGDPARTRATGQRVSMLATDFADLVHHLEGIDDGRWQGKAADAFRNDLGDGLKLLNTARESLDRGGYAITGWAHTMTEFQARTDQLEREAARREQELQAAKQAAATVGATPSTGPGGLDQATLQDRVDQARAAQNQIQDQAQELHDEYRRAAKSARGHLDDASGIAPEEPGFIEGMYNAAVDGLGAAVDAAGRWVREHAEAFELFANVMSTISAVAGLLSFVPVIGSAAALVAVGASLGAMAAEGALLAAGAKNASWQSFAMAGVGAVAGATAIGAGRKLVSTYEASSRAAQLGRARTVTGLVTGKTKPVAPGVIGMAKRGATMTTPELKLRTVRVTAHYSGLANTGAGAPGTIGHLQRWSGDGSSSRRGPSGPAPASS